MDVVQKDFPNFGPYDIRYYLAYEKQKGLSNRSVENIRSNISAFFQWMTREEIIVKNPCLNIKPIKYTDSVRLPFSDVEIDELRCGCENRLGLADLKYTVATENCADRTAAYQNTRDIIDSQTRGTQAILDKLCQLELDGVKAQVDAKNDQILSLQNQLNMATLKESQIAQNAFIAQGLNNEVDALYNRLNNCPVPTTPVYGRTPIFTCNNGGCNCGNNF